MDPSLARRMWTVLEPLHAVVYFAPEPVDAMKAAGLKGFWMSYFAGRAAPMGPVAAAVVTATFFGFEPAMVGRAIPDAWRLVAPEDVLAARQQGAVRALGRLLGPPAGEEAVAEAADLARRAVEGTDGAGRPLFAANAAQRWPADPLAALWQAATCLREHRGDGHVAVLVSAGLDGCQAQVVQVAAGVVPRAQLQPARGWSDDDWSLAEDGLRSGGWLTDDGRLTEAGVAARAEVESRTDQLALEPFVHLGDEGTARLYDLVAPLSRAVVAGGGLPVPNPMGASAPE